MAKKILSLILIATGVEAVVKSIEKVDSSVLAEEIVELVTEQNNTIEQISKEKKELESEYETLKIAHQQLQQDIINAPEKTIVTNEQVEKVFEVDGNKYAFIGNAANIEGKEVSYKDIVTNPSICKMLVESNSCLIKPI